jgi:hypothetical protein
MRETGLMRRVMKLPVRLPAVTLQDTGMSTPITCAACASPRPG